MTQPEVFLAGDVQSGWGSYQQALLARLASLSAEQLALPVASHYLPIGELLVHMLEAGRIPGAELPIIQGGRHGFLVEKRSEASRVVNAFLARHPLS